MRKILIGLAALSLTTLPVQAQDILDEAPALAMRSTVPLPPRRMQGGSVYAIVTQAAARHGVPHSLAHGVTRVESGHRCVNGRYRGPMQILTSTARSVGGSTGSCEASVEAGMRYLARMYRAAGGDHCLAASGYQRGHISGCSAYGRRVLRASGA